STPDTGSEEEAPFGSATCVRASQPQPEANEDNHRPRGDSWFMPETSDLSIGDVELVVHSAASSTGIGRYTSELSRALACSLRVHLTHSQPPPFASRLSFLRHLPVGLRGHRPGNIVHFMQILGCSQMIWHPVHPAVATVHDLGMLVWPREAT